MTADTTAMKMEADLREPGNDPILLAAIRAVQHGDSRAFEHIMTATERRVALLSWRILGDAEEVKDAMQETFLRVYRHLGTFDERRDFMGWLFRIAVNVCRDRLARSRKRTRVFTNLDESESIAAIAGSDDVHASLAAKQELEQLTRAVDTLPEKERLALILRDVEQLPTEQVAQILGSRPSTVRVQIHSARAKLRKLMEPWR
jgi:RNA polymerase sigma-70 factor (ECF subfamily)